MSVSNGVEPQIQPGALRGYRILDYTTALAGPRLTQYLAQMGAEVIHVESIQYLDTHRGWSKRATNVSGQHPNNDPGARPWERNSQYNNLNKNKLGITLNLGDPRGVALFKRLAAVSDVVVDNYKAGMTDRFGVGYTALRKVRPDIIYLSLPAFGSDGPYRDYTAWGNQVAALAGHGLLLNYPGEQEPLPVGTYGDPVAALTGAFGIAAALIHRERTGEGQYIETALAEVLPGLLPDAIADYALNGRIARPLGNQNPAASPWGVYRCEGDDHWVAICCVDDRDFTALCGAIGRPELPSNPSYASLPARIANRSSLDALIEAWTAGRSAEAVADLLQSAGVAAEPACTLADVLAEPQLEARGYFFELTHPDAGTHRYPLQPVQMSRTPVANYQPAPTYGQHNANVLGDLIGLTPAELEDLTAAEVIGDEPLEDRERQRRTRPSA
jgi:crotonobetainyl-CoA:carnitine CoA-transferase CaiB-like acyl-CoA transferase